MNQTNPNNPPKEPKTFTKTSEDLFIEYFLNSPDILVRCMSVTRPEIFNDPDNKRIIAFVLDYADAYNDVPTRTQVRASTGIHAVGAPGFKVTESNTDWFFDEYQHFVKDRNIGDAILDVAELHKEGDYDAIMGVLKEATEIGLPKDFGIDWADDPSARLKALLDSQDMSSTGLKTIDDCLFGGFSVGELNIFCARSGDGKTIWLLNLAYKWMLAGKKVLFVTLELSESKNAQRLDMIHTGMSSQDLFKNMEKVDLAAGEHKRTCDGGIRIIKMPGLATNANRIKSFMKEYEIQHGHGFDAVIVDYMGLMVPNSARVSPNNRFDFDEAVATELREMAIAEKLLLATASQFNRSGSATDIFESGHEHISGGISKINTADNVLFLYRINKFQPDEHFVVKFEKTRSSTGQGRFVKIDYDGANMRLSDFSAEALAGMDDAVPDPADAVRRKSGIGGAGKGKAAPTLAKSEDIYSGDKTTQQADLMKLIGKSKNE